MKPEELKTKTAQDLAIELAQLFHHHDYRWIEAENQPKPNWVTRTDHPLSTGELVREYLDIEKLIGVGFGKTTKYVAIDLDWLSHYHPRFGIALYLKLLHALETIGLTRHLVIQSSYSGGLYIYFPLPYPVKTFQIAAAVRVTLIKAGFEVKNGQLEIFPNTKRFAAHAAEYSHYRLHRLPLQPKSGSWLMEDDGLSPQPIPDTIEAQLGAFLAQWQMAAAGQDMKKLNRKLPQLYAQFKQCKQKYQPRTDEEKSVKAKKWEADLDLDIAIGWTDFGQTYQLLPKFLAKGVVFHKLAGEELYQWMHTSITTAPGFNQYSRHQHEIGKLIRSWIKTNERTGYYSPYRSEPDRSQPYPFGDPKYRTKQPDHKPHPANIKRAESAIHRIRTAYGCVRHLFISTTTIIEMREIIRAKIQQLFGLVCSNSTLNKYKNIWHPEYNDTANICKDTPNFNQENSPEIIPDILISSCINELKTEQKSVQIQALSQPAQSQPPMICCPPVQKEKINTPPHPREIQHSSNYDVHQASDSPQPKGKFEVLAGALAKIISVAALVVNVVSSVGITSEPSLTAEIAPIEPQPTATIQADAEDLPVPPSQNPRIPSIDLYPYNPNQIGVPWKSKAERDKFAGYLVITAKYDKSILNPYAWATQTLKNLKESGINSHWLAFTGQQIIDPNSPQAQFLRELFPPATPSPTNFTIHHQSEPISTVVERVIPSTQQSDPPHQTNVLPIHDPNIQTHQANIEISQSSVEPSRDIPNRVNHSHHEIQPQTKPNSSCPECDLLSPQLELERWGMCRFCATKILFKRKI